jgi:hypothetical protein
MKNIYFVAGYLEDGKGKPGVYLHGDYTGAPIHMDKYPKVFSEKEDAEEFFDFLTAFPKYLEYESVQICVLDLIEIDVYKFFTAKCLKSKKFSLLELGREEK